MIRRAVERDFAIIGEAIVRARQVFQRLRRGSAQPETSLRFAIGWSMDMKPSAMSGFGRRSKRVFPVCLRMWQLYSKSTIAGYDPLEAVTASGLPLSSHATRAIGVSWSWVNSTSHCSGIARS